jgi:hypothetical protein
MGSVLVLGEEPTGGVTVDGSMVTRPAVTMIPVAAILRQMVMAQVVVLVVGGLPGRGSPHSGVGCLVLQPEFVTWLVRGRAGERSRAATVDDPVLCTQPKIGRWPLATA